MSSGLFENFIYKLCAYKSYVLKGFSISPTKGFGILPTIGGMP